MVQKVVDLNLKQTIQGLELKNFVSPAENGYLVQIRKKETDGLLCLRKGGPLAPSASTAMLLETFTYFNMYDCAVPSGNKDDFYYDGYYNMSYRWDKCHSDKIHV